MTVSIIIAVATWQKNLERCVRECLALEFPDFEILILPDALIPQDVFYSSSLPLAKRNLIRVIPTGPVSPAAKRDIGLQHATGGILAFIDDDAYPRKDWLTNAVKNFTNDDTAAVGGPAVTPPDDSLKQKASGLIYASVLTSGTYVYRYVPQQRREVEDFPSCNLLVRREIMKKLGGFNTKFWPGEDTKLCLEITHTLKKKIIYDPEVLIYHHRRKSLLSHLAQIANYALHRGYFAKRMPQTSLRVAYFVPSIFVACLVAGSLASICLLPVRPYLFFMGTLYCIIVFISCVSNVLQPVNRPTHLLQKVFLITFSFVGIIATHITYGIFFILGLLSRKLKEER